MELLNPAFATRQEVSSAIQIRNSLLLILGTSGGSVEVWDYEKRELLINSNVFETPITSILELDMFNQVIVSDGKRFSFFNFSTGGVQSSTLSLETPSTKLRQIDENRLSALLDDGTAQRIQVLDFAENTSQLFPLTMLYPQLRAKWQFPFEYTNSSLEASLRAAETAWLVFDQQFAYFLLNGSDTLQMVTGFSS